MQQAVKLYREDRGFVRFDKADIETSIPERFERQVHIGPHRTAVACGRRTLSYDDLNRMSNRIAGAILRRRGDTEEPIALLFRQGPTAVAATLGSLKAGKIYVPLDPNRPAPGLQGIVADCQPSLIVTDRENAALARGLAGEADRCLVVETATVGKSEGNPGLDLRPDRASYIFYTSGTSGPPKGIVDSHRNVLHNVMRYTNGLGIGASDRLSLIQSCAFSGTVSSLYSALLNGAAICPFDLQGRGIVQLANWIERESVTVFHSVPAIFEQLMATGRGFDSLRMIRLEGDRAEPRQIASFQARFGADRVLVNGLGTTETGIVRQYFVTPRTKMAGDVVPIGHAVEDMDVNVVGRDGHSIEHGRVGEITVRSRYLACGYWRRPDLTEAAFVPDPADPTLRIYRTGDLGRMGADGCLEYLGRMDFRAKLRGQWIEAAEIENSLCKLAPISQALVVVRDDDSGAQQLVAYLVAAAPPPSIDSIRRMLSQTLPAILIPSRYVFIASMPLDRNGKIDRRALPAPGRQRPVLDQPFMAPRTPDEGIVADCVCAVLKIDQVGVHDDFLDLGGDSLLATELLMRLEDRLKVACPASLIAQTFSVASITGRLGQDNSESALVPIQAGDDRSPLFCIHNQTGYVLEYFRLARYLDPDRTIYGLQSRAFTRTRLQDTRVEDMAAAYVAEITARQADGPYHLCGHCFGGVIAFEIAQQLRRLGREVALLALIDTAYPSGVLGLLARHARNEWRRLSNLNARHWPAHVASRVGALTRRVARGSKRWIVPAREPVAGGKREPNSSSSGVAVQNKIAEFRYRPRRYDREVVLICAGRPHNQRGWIGLAKGGCRVIELPFDGPPEKAPHLTCEPYVGQVAAHISEFLVSADSIPGPPLVAGPPGRGRTSAHLPEH